MTVLVVGGTGFIGRAIVQTLTQSGREALALSRSARIGVSGDVTQPDFGLDRQTASRLQDSVTHIVSCFGSVDWAGGPRQALDLHLAGTTHVLNFAARCSHLERLVHVSSILALGRADGTVGNRQLNVGQTFRNWYEYGKYRAEAAVRAEERLPTRSVRLGPILGVLGGQPPAPSGGLLAALPSLLRGYPAHIDRRGAFPCYVTDVSSASSIVVGALFNPEGGLTWTWFDPSAPSLAEVLTELCAAWNVTPRIIESSAFGTLSRTLAKRVGLPRTLVDYAEPWVDIDPHVIDELPLELPQPPRDYVRATGEAIIASRSALPS